MFKFEASITRAAVQKTFETKPVINDSNVGQHSFNIHGYDV
ncbi:hypothetical protein H320_20535 [Vibrio parahaemolyticus 49]|nr:hypothetical protein [Vibrio parahaemolyticus]KIT40525.1 hypothetical protein H320_20535 [Vibrio parahaemolyticus 49]EGQ8884099.1 hypothetical protein [Vibrio parahaemolyticus]EGQ8916981.1 hypothetical protein [Vibrio parahaemolyticus]EGQ8936728.1 hypothetical protein [Vibrio parahaemolyticus]